MKRVELSRQILDLLKASKRVCSSLKIEAVLLLTEVAYPFAQIQRGLRGVRLIVASDDTNVHEACVEDQVRVVKLLNEPQTRQTQVGQAILEAIADEHLKSGQKLVAIYPTFDRRHVDTISVISLTEQLSRLSSRDLQRLETQVPLETLRMVVDMALEIGREGREGKPIGTLFVVGSHRKVLQQSHEQIHDPFRGYTRKERLLRNPRVRESVKELAQIDGAFVISADGVVEAAGRILDAAADGLTLSKGLGARHWAAAAISKSTDAIAIAVSESTGTVRLFQNGVVVLRIEPMRRAMKWQDVDVEPPSAAGDRPPAAG